MDIISIGEALIDFTPGKEDGSYIRNPGGAPANFAVGASKNGLHVGFIGRVGADDFGRFIYNVLKANKVKVLVKDLLEEALTTMAFVTLYQGGERSFTFARKPGADMYMSISDIKEDYIKGCMVLHAGSFSMSESPAKEATVYAMKLAHELGKIVSFDVNYRPIVWKSQEEAIAEVRRVLPYIDLLKISEEEIDFVGGEANIHNIMQEYGLTAVIVTLGSEGAKYFFNGKSGRVEGIKVNAIDATGAGDAFWSGFISKLLLDGVKDVTEITESNVKEALKYGNIAGALCVQKIRGIPALPTRKEIEDLFNYNKYEIR